MKLLFGALAGLLVVASIAAAVVLVPPHLQIRAVEPALPSELELRALARVPDGPVRLRFINVAAQSIDRGELGHNVILVEWADGKIFMIDAAMDRQHAADFAELLGTMSNGGEASFAGSIDTLLGADLARVQGVGFTHLHIDHAQGIVPFCAARGTGVKLVQTSWQAEQHNLHTQESAELLAAQIAASCLERVPLAGGELKRVSEFPGLGIAALGGHTPGSTLFAVSIDGHLWLFSGDTTNDLDSLLNNKGKGFVYSNLLVPENTERTEALRLWLSALHARPDVTVVVSHDLPALRSLAASGLSEYRP